MACSQEELQIEIKKAGDRLLHHPPTSVDSLIKHLDQLEGYLSHVDQSPSESMKIALAPCLKALVAAQLMRHSDDDVRVSAASCISEITRITAPEAPYDDNQMKVIFQLIVSSFEKLSDKSSRAFIKRTAILETVAKVRSCVLMLDLDCDALIIQMLHNFLKEIRDYHPDNVYSSMETIMTLVLEESEDISLELLSPILAAVKRNNKEIMPIARRMAEKVLQNCAAKIRPSLKQSVKSSDISLDDYSLIVANICEETPDIGEKNVLYATDEHLVNESKLASGASSTEAAQVAKETAAEADYLEEVDPAAVSSPKPVMSNGVAQPQDENALVDSNMLKNTEQSDDIRHSNSNAEHDSLGAKGIVESEVQHQKTIKRRGRKRKSSTKVTKPSKETAAKPSLVDVTEPVDSSTTIGEKEHEKLIEKSQSKEICSSSYKDPSLEAVQPSESKVENAIQSGSANVVSPSPSGNLRDKSHPRKPGRTKKILIQEPTLPADTASKKHSEGSIDSKVKAHEQSRKRAPGGTLKEDRRPANVDNSKENSTGSDPEIKSLKEVRKAMDTSYITEHGSSKRKKKAKSFGDERSSREEDIQKLSVKDVDKETFESKDKSAETPETNSKRGRTPGKATKLLNSRLISRRKSVRTWLAKRSKYGGHRIRSFMKVALNLGIPRRRDIGFYIQMETRNYYILEHNGGNLLKGTMFQIRNTEQLVQVQRNHPRADIERRKSK